MRYSQKLRLHAPVAALLPAHVGQIDNRRQRVLIAKFGRRMLHKQHYAAFAAFTHAVRHTKSLKRRLASISRRMRNSSLASAFRGWQTKVDGRKRARKSILRTLSRIRLRKEATAFRAWGEQARSARFITQQSADRKIMIRRAVTAMKHARIARAFTWWHSNAQTAASHRRRLAAYIKRIQHENVWRTFNAWRANTDDRIRISAMLRRLLARCNHHFLHKGFRSLQEFVLHEQSREIEIGKLAMRDQRVQEMVARIVTKGKTRAFLRWKWFRQNAKIFREKANKYLARFQKSRLSMAFQGFVAAVVAARVNRKRVQQCLVRMKRRRAWQALNRLRSFAEAQRRAKAMYVSYLCFGSARRTS